MNLEKLGIKKKPTEPIKKVKKPVEGFVSIKDAKLDILKHKVLNTSGKERQENREKLLLQLGAKPRAKTPLTRVQQRELKESENIAANHAQLLEKIKVNLSRPFSLRKKVKVRNADGSVSFISKKAKKKLQLKKKQKISKKH